MDQFELKENVFDGVGVHRILSINDDKWNLKERRIKIKFIKNEDQHKIFFGRNVLIL